MKKILSIAKNEIIFIVLLLIGFVIIISGNEKTEIVTYNLNSTKSVQAVHLVSKYNPAVEKVKKVNSFKDVLKYGSTNPIQFTGLLTGYGPDCKGCSGFTGCSPSQNVKNGNIYFDDNTYGKVRIVAASSKIPCGSIVKISNSSLSKSSIVAVVLDRGGAIQGTKMDFLERSEKEALKIGKQTVTYEIVRWGW